MIINFNSRIAKIIARAGICSRREAERLILAGKVKLNGAVLLNCATCVTENDQIIVDGKIVSGYEDTRLFIFNKPRGCITSNKDDQGRKLIFDYIPKEYGRLITIGRLDYNSEGLILLTNDGELSRLLESPESNLPRTYRVRAFGSISDDMIKELEAGVVIDGLVYKGIVLAVDKIQGDNIWLTMTLYEGKNREIKSILSHYGIKVSRLIRISYGQYKLEDLEVGSIKEVHDQNYFRKI